MNFSDLSLHPKILEALQEAGYVTPTLIQQEAIPAILEGRDLQASSQTGTGKTAAFVLPALQRLMSKPLHSGKGPRVLIVCPTRELALQIFSETQKYAAKLNGIRAVPIFGGVAYGKQNADLARPYDILIATPGRLLDLMEKKRISLHRVELFVIDEADRMLDMGFIDPVEQIAAKTPEDRQTLLFSATLKRQILNLCKSLLRSPHEILLAPKTHDLSIEQKMYHTTNVEHKQNLLEHLLTDTTITQAIVFAATKRYADEISEKLRQLGHSCESLHGDMNQRKRTSTIKRLRSNHIKILVATDVAARGIDLATISHVINFDLPRTAEDYVHRIGRTGRAGKKGVAHSFISSKDRTIVKQIELFMNKKLDTFTIEGLEPQSAPSPLRRNRSKRPRFKTKSRI